MEYNTKNAKADIKIEVRGAKVSCKATGNGKGMASGLICLAKICKNKVFTKEIF